jgi:cobalt-precorrin-5B (C1)-methyltransferase
MTTLRTGWTTGTCAAAAAKAAAGLLCGNEAADSVEVALPDGTTTRLPVIVSRLAADEAVAGVRKDAGDDPDVTHGSTIMASVRWQSSGDVVFLAGEGVGTVTKPGLQIPPGEPAINPVPRRMIRQAIREVTDKPVAVTISIPGGRELAEQTFNPRLGIIGGLSILGTTGIVRPRCVKALRDALQCALDVAAACTAKALVLVPGNIGAKAVRARFTLLPEQIIEVSNEWGWVLDRIPDGVFTSLLAVGHPGKLAKLAEGEWQTHSHRSPSAVPYVHRLAVGQGLNPPPPPDTVEGIFMALSPAARSALGNALAASVRSAIATKTGNRLPVSVLLVDMKGEELGSSSRTHPIVIAGCGPGAPELITPAAHAAAEAADVLVGAKRLLDLFAPAHAERIPVGADIGAVLERMAAIAPSRKIVVLVSGDPGFHSLGRSILARFGRSACRVIPGISSVQAAFASIGVTWEDVCLVSTHTALPPFTPASLVDRDKIAVLAGNRATAAWLDEAVRVLHSTHAVFVCSDLSLPEERVEEVLSDGFKAERLPSRTILIFVKRGLLE